ncbi:hypothetical protein ACLESD_02115 [Pyxidicoccus sp. 3LFB2]
MQLLKQAVPLFAALALMGCGPVDDDNVPPESPKELGVEEQSTVSACTGPTNSKCWKIPPLDTDFGGATTTWNSPHYVLRPNTPSKAHLVVMLHGVNGTAGGFASTSYATANTTFYASAVNKGYRTIGLTHRNSPNVREICGTNMDCHLPTRRTYITGVTQPGSAVTGMGYYDGIEARLIRVLVYLRNTQDPTGGWGAYLTPADCTGTKNSTKPCTLVWSNLVVAGHSQGAGHAAVIGKDHLVDTVVMVAGPTDHYSNTSFPGYTLASSGLATPAGGGNYRGLVHTNDGFETAALKHWGADRLNLGTYGKTTSITTDGCGTSAHNCVVQADELYSVWQGFWP